MTIKVHHLRPAPGAKKAKTRVGRGEASKGKTAGRGTKGTGARNEVAGRFEGGQMPMHMRLPKLRGFKNPFTTEYQVVNLDRLVSLFPDGGEIGVDDLVAKGAVRPKHLVKVLGTGEIGVRRPGHRRCVLRVRAREDRSRRRERSPPASGRRSSAPSTGNPLPCDRLLQSPYPTRESPRRPDRTEPPQVAAGGYVLSAFYHAFRTPDLRRKILFTLGVLAVFRLGSVVPAPASTPARSSSASNRCRATSSTA